MISLYKIKEVAVKIHITGASCHTIAGSAEKYYINMNRLSLPLTEKIHAEELSLPMSPTPSAAEVAYVISIINNYS